MRLTLSLFFLLNTILIYCQNVTYTYELAYRPSQENRFVKNENYYLDISESQSVFRSEREKHSDSVNFESGRSSINYLDFNQIYSRKDLRTKKVFKTITTPIYGDSYDILIEDLNWKISPETELISNINCQKATLEYGGRKWEAWFTESIPLPEGPYIFNGLPGLIIEIIDDKGDYAFSLIESKKAENNNLFKIKTGKLINWSIMEKIQMNFYENPFGELKSKSAKMIVTDDKGNKLDRSYDDMSRKMQKSLKEKNNPIELNDKIEYK